MQQVYSVSAEQTQAFAAEFAKQIAPGELLALTGDLGTGKTTFVQGLAKGLGITHRIISPTFIILRTYVLPTLQFYHADLYRLQGEADIAGTGLLEVLEKKEAIVAIEWPEKMGGLLPKHRWNINFAYGNENMREITIEKK